MIAYISRVDVDNGCRFADWTEPIDESLPVGNIYRAYCREYGRCTGRVRIDTKGREGMPIGWVFLKRDRYDDTHEPYLAETWVSLAEDPPAPAPIQWHALE